MRLTEDMRRVVLEQKLGFAATVCPDGTPSLSPKGTTTVWDERHLLFADIASPNTVRNLRANPAIEINVVDPVVRKGYRFKGTATLHSDGRTYERALELLAERGYDVGFTYLQDPEETARLVRDAGARVEFVELDLTEPSRGADAIAALTPHA